MSSANKARGTRWERQCAEYLRAVFPRVERAPRWGSVDKGDLINTGEFTFECKATRSMDLASFVDEANKESANAGTKFGVALVKRRNRSTDDAYVVMDMETFLLLAAELPTYMTEVGPGE